MACSGGMYGGRTENRAACVRSDCGVRASSCGAYSIVAAGSPGHVTRPGCDPLSRAGDAPVHDLDLAEVADHDVRRLQVAVDHPLRVGVADGLGDLLEDREQPAALQNRVQPIEHSVQRLVPVDSGGDALSAAGAFPCFSMSSSVRPPMSFMVRKGRPSASEPTR